MLSKDELQQLREVIREENKPLQKGQESLKVGLERIEKKLDREVTDLAETQREILIKLDKLQDHEARIADLEGKPVPRSH